MPEVVERLSDLVRDEQSSPAWRLGEGYSERRTLSPGHAAAYAVELRSTGNCSADDPRPKHRRNGNGHPSARAFAALTGWWA